MTFTIPPATRMAGDSGFVADIDDAYAALSAVAGINALNTAYAGGADPSGTADSTAAIQAALNAAPAGGAVLLPAGVYKVTSPLTVPSAVMLQAAAPGSGSPIANFGAGPLPLHGSVLKPSSAFSGAGVIEMASSGAQAGGQRIFGVTIDGSSLPGGNTVNGIQAVGAVADVKIRDCVIYKNGGHGMWLQSNSDGNPDNWYVDLCELHGQGGHCVYLQTGVSDSTWTNVWASASTLDVWNITNGAGSVYIRCRAEGGSAYGWNLTGLSGFASPVHFIGCRSAQNTTGGWSLSGAGAGTWYFTACIAADTTPWAYSGTTNLVRSPAAYNTSPSAPTFG